MAILICNIIDGIAKQTAATTTVMITEKNMTAIGMLIDDVALLDKDKRRSEILSHYQKINALYFSEYNMVPLRFGNVVDSEEEVRQFLNSTYVLLYSLLKKVSNKTEFVIQIRFDMDLVIKQISSQLDMNDKIVVGKALFDLSEHYRTEIYDGLTQRIATLGIDVLESSSQVSSSLILNQSYLVQNEDKDVFDEMVSDLAETTDELVVFHYLGPLPPYSFVTIEFNRGVFDLMDNARLLLGLEEKCTMKDVKDNYKKLAQRYHPDKNPTGNEKFKAINEAYQLVSAYCSNATEADQQWSFSKESIESCFIQNG